MSCDLTFQNKHPPVSSPVTFFCYHLHHQLLTNYYVVLRYLTAWRISEAFLCFSVWSVQWESHFVCFSLKNDAAFARQPIRETMLMCLKGGKTFFLQYFYLKCDLNLTEIVVYVYFSFLFAFMTNTHDVRCHFLAVHKFLWAATKTHADTKKQTNKKPPLHSCWTWAETHNITSVIEFNDAFFAHCRESLWP